MTRTIEMKAAPRFILWFCCYSFSMRFPRLSEFGICSVIQRISGVMRGVDCIPSRHNNKFHRISLANLSVAVPTMGAI